ncbi:MAG: DNA repair protein RecO [Candidatus Omnitrophota bacterium]
MILKTEAIVLKSFDFRETSRIATFFTKDYGKVKGILKGIRKDHKKFGSHIDKFSVNDIVYYHSRHSDLHLVSHCDLKNFYFPIREDLKRSLAANYLLELVEGLLPAEEPNRDIYQLMLDYLESLQSIGDINRLVYVLQIKLLLLSGFKPHLDSCLKCGKKIHGKAKFSVHLGGLVCLNCNLPEATFTVISSGTVSSILHIERNDWPISLKLGLSPSCKRELKYVLNNFLVFHLGRKIKTEKFIHGT